MTNEITKNEIAETQENGIVVAQTRTNIISETKDFVVVQDKETGKFSRKAKYNEFSSFKATNRAEKIWLLNILEGEEESGSGLKDNIGAIIEVEHIITRPYDKVNEDTGEMEYGVLTYLITPEKEVYVTSSKTVYFSINKIMDLFGTPDSDEWENIKVAVGKEKGANGDIVKIKMIG